MHRKIYQIRVHFEYLKKIRSRNEYIPTGIKDSIITTLAPTKNKKETIKDEKLLLDTYRIISNKKSIGLIGEKELLEKVKKTIKITNIDVIKQVGETAY